MLSRGYIKPDNRMEGMMMNIAICVAWPAVCESVETNKPHAE